MNQANNSHLDVDANGCRTERVEIGPQTVVVHHDDIPETARRAGDVMDDCLDRGLFTIEEMRSRLSKTDLARRHGVRALIDQRR